MSEKLSFGPIDLSFGQIDLSFVKIDLSFGLIGLTFSKKLTDIFAYILLNFLKNLSQLEKTAFDCMFITLEGIFSILSANIQA